MELLFSEYARTFLDEKAEDVKKAKAYINDELDLDSQWKAYYFNYIYGVLLEDFSDIVKKFV